jgi:hypothetical protein
MQRSSVGSPATFVDIAGDGEVRLAVHSHYGDELVHSMAVGVTHWEELEGRVDPKTANVLSLD